MQKKTEIFPEIIFASSIPAEAKKMSRLMSGGKIRKIAPKIYTGNHHKSIEILIKENWRRIIAHFYPNTVISHRTAFMGGRIEDNTVFITTSFTKTIKLPGLIIRALKGVSPIKYDMPLPEKTLFLSSEPRFLMENLQISRASKSIKKSIGIEKVELYLEKLIRNRGEDVVNSIRDKAKEIYPDLGFDNEFKLLDSIIGSLLSTRNNAHLLTQVGKSRHAGMPYDPDRLDLFEVLFNYLRNIESYQPFKKMTEPEWRNSAFYDAYFSNYIEGTDFLIGEAKSIVFEGKIIKDRISDSHDVLGTYRVLNDHTKMLKLPVDANEFIELLKMRHHEIMGFREDINPGEFKNGNNRAGNTEFVNHELVKETLKRGFEYYHQLDKGFQKAVYMMFIIAEVHPFLDGNGRVSRIFMNAEMISGQHQRILIPTVYREDYLLSLRRLSRSSDPKPFVKMLSRAARFSSRLNFSNIDETQIQLEKCEAFNLPNEGQLIIPQILES